MSSTSSATSAPGHGDLNAPLAPADAIYIEDGRVKEVGTSRRDADLVIDARGNLVTPGLIDSHVHPSFGDFTPVQNSTSWITHYLHGGTTRMVSAGELHLPGLPIDRPDPAVFRSLALVTRACYDNFRPGGVKVEAGTLLLVPGLGENDFATVARAGSRLVKFIFYPYGQDPAEQANYVTWAHRHGLVVKIHSGGVSRSGVSRPAGAEVLLGLKPDIAGHLNGGPIPMPLAEAARVVNESEMYLELAYCGNFAVAQALVGLALAKGALARVILGTDTPSGTGVTPRGMLRLMALVASCPGIRPEETICLATGGPARAHGWIRASSSPALRPTCWSWARSRRQRQGRPGIPGPGNLLGISLVMIDGKLAVRGRSQQTPRPRWRRWSPGKAPRRHGSFPDAAASLIGPGQALFDQGRCSWWSRPGGRGALRPAALAGARRRGASGRAGGAAPPARLVYRPGEPTPGGTAVLASCAGRWRGWRSPASPHGGGGRAFADLVLQRPWRRGPTAAW